MALMLFDLAVPAGVLIAVQEGPPSLLGFLASLVTHSDRAPARSRLGSFGSRMKGAMKFAVPLLASVIGFARARFSHALPFQKL